MQRLSHLLEPRLHGRIGGEVVELLGVLAQVVQLFQNVFFAPDVSPVSLGQ